MRFPLITLAFVLVLGARLAAPLRVNANEPLATPSLSTILNRYLDAAQRTAEHVQSASRLFAISRDIARSPLRAEPVRLKIPALGVNAAIEHVGLDENLAVDVPAHVMNAAWWEGGAIPGNQGNAIVVGHLDDYNGNPAVFWDLEKIAVGDRLAVVDANYATTMFEVIEVAVYRFDDLSVMDKIYGQTSEYRLNIITCNGAWDAATRNYENRLVVYTRLVR